MRTRPDQPGPGRFRALAQRAVLVVLASAAGLVVVAGIAAWNYGTDAIARAGPARIAPPSDMAVETVVLAQAGKPALGAWVVAKEGGCGAVLLLHGRGASKASLLGRARLLLAAGHSVALLDLSGHGESEGDIRGFGYAEGEDATRALRYLRERFPGEPIGAVGTSLGAAALVFADLDLAADAYVLEQLYSTLAETTALRAPLPFARQAQATVLLAQMPLRLGYDARSVRPVDRIGRLGAPKLLLASTRDPFVGRDQSEALLAAAGPAARLEWFDLDGHVDLERRAPERYRETVLPFLSRHLCRKGGRGGADGSWQGQCRSGYRRSKQVVAVPDGAFFRPAPAGALPAAAAGVRCFR